MKPPRPQTRYSSHFSPAYDRGLAVIRAIRNRSNVSTPEDKVAANTHNIAELKDSIQRGDLVVITGTGVSLQAAKPLKVEGFEIVTWIGLLLHGIHRCQTLGLIDATRAEQLKTRVSWKQVEELVQVADIITKELQRHSPGTYQKWLEDTVAKLELANPRVIDALVKLGGILATLNYDSVLEKRTKRATVSWTDSASVSAVVNGRQVEAAGQMVDAVLHLHGHWQNANSVVLGTASYAQVIAHPHAQAVQQLFAVGRTMLFVGCGGTIDDPNFEQFITAASKVLTLTTKAHFILCRAGEVAALRGKVPWLHPIAYGENHSDLAPFLENITQSGGQPPVAAPAPAPVPAPGGGVSFDAEWALATTSSKPELFAELLLLNRKPAIEALDRVVSGQTSEIGLQTRFSREIITFIAAYLADRGLLNTPAGRGWTIVRDRETWERSSALTEGRLVLVAHPNLAFEANRNEFVQMARAHGHAIIYPTLTARADDKSVVPLREPKRHEVLEVLTKHKIPAVQADQLANRSNGNLPLLLRYLTNTPERPSWAAEDKATLLRPLALLGGWQTDMPADLDVIGTLIGRDYHEWVSALFPILHGEDPPFVHSVNVFRPVSRYENWQLLGGYLTDADLNRFQAVAIKVLRAHDAKFDLPENERMFAGIRGKPVQCSESLRQGLADTLALMAGQPEVLTNCSPGKVREIAYAVVHGVLTDVDWKRWASLGSLVSLLAEADPDTYLKIIEADLRQPAAAVLKHLFGEVDGGIFGGFYQSGFLWSLEVLAWKPEYLNRVALILSELTAFPLPENMGNNPLASLRNIFLPWMPQTTASIEQRKVAVQGVIQANPETGWKLLLQLLPESYSTTSRTQRPQWRDWIPRDWRDGVTNGERWEQEQNYANLALDVATKDRLKLQDLLSRVDHLPEPTLDALLARLAALSATDLPDTERLPLWQKLVHEIARHRRFADAKWAMPAEVLAKLDNAAQAIEPKSPEVRHQALFNFQSFELCQSEDFDADEKHIAEQREKALAEVRARVGLKGILQFAREVVYPGDVGTALGTIADPECDAFILPALLETAEKSFTSLAGGYVWSRFHKEGVDWLPQLPLKEWTPVQIGLFFSQLPFTRDVWTRAETALGEHAKEYWSHIEVRPRGTPDDLLLAAEKLLQFNRGTSALRAVHNLIQTKNAVPPDLVIRTVRSFLASLNSQRQSDHYELNRVLEYLQKHAETNQEELTQLEWLLLPILDRIHDRAPAGLERALAEQPAFFAQIIGICYRPKDQPKPATPPDDTQRGNAERGFRLLRGWRTAPGLKDNVLDRAALRAWLTEVRKLCEASGHWEIAQSHIGHVLVHVPKDPDNLWLHRAAAEVLNAKEHHDMLGGFTSELFNQRGAYMSTGGKAERELAADYQSKARDLDNAGYSFLAAALRGLAESYIREAEREEKEDRTDT